jgi:16S rRNA processing protein RimM
VAGLFAIGKVIKAHSLKGSMKAVSYVDSDELLKSLNEVILDKKGSDSGSFKVESISISKKSFILKVEGIEDAQTAGQWIGSDVLASSSILKKLPEGEYYWHNLIGLKVITEEGRYLGRIDQIFSPGSNDVYICKEGRREILLPAIEDVIRKVDAEKGVMVVNLCEGLQDG